MGNFLFDKEKIHKNFDYCRTSIYRVFAQTSYNLEKLNEYLKMTNICQIRMLHSFCFDFQQYMGYA